MALGQWKPFQKLLSRIVRGLTAKDRGHLLEEEALYVLHVEEGQKACC